MLVCQLSWRACREAEGAHGPLFVYLSAPASPREWDGSGPASRTDAEAGTRNLVDPVRL